MYAGAEGPGLRMLPSYDASRASRNRTQIGCTAVVKTFLFYELDSFLQKIVGARS